MYDIFVVVLAELSCVIVVFWRYFSIRICEICQSGYLLLLFRRMHVVLVLWSTRDENFPIGFIFDYSSIFVLCPSFKKGIADTLHLLFHRHRGGLCLHYPRYILTTRQGANRSLGNATLLCSNLYTPHPHFWPTCYKCGKSYPSKYGSTCECVNLHIC